ncbi:MAG: tetratricopeptide repeat protein [Acidobacteriota bacterium]|nr:tetratricopeptide repeat protein [Acidobacteriota bacterium]
MLRSAQHDIDPYRHYSLLPWQDIDAQRNFSRSRRLTLAAAAVMAVAFLCHFDALIRAETRQEPSPDFAAAAAKAQSARGSGRLNEAAALYKKALAMRPSWAAGWWSLGTIEYDQNDYAGAASAFAKVTTLAPNGGTAWVMLGLCEFELGRDADSLAHIEKGKLLGIANDPQLRQVMLYHEGVLLRRAGKFEEARESFGELCKDGVRSSQVERAFGMTDLRLRSASSAAPAASDAEVVAQIGQAECLAAAGKFDEAREIYRSVTAKNPSYPGIHCARGKFLLEIHDTKGAAQEFERAIQQNPHDEQALLELAAIKYRVDSKAGLPYAGAAVKLDPQLPFGHYLLGLLLADTKQYQEAIRELEIARPSFSNAPNLYYALGTAYARTGRQKEATSAWAAFARLSSKEGKSGLLYYGQMPSGVSNPAR